MYRTEFKDAEWRSSSTLSGGQQQRMYLNRGKKNRQSPLVIMDEPFSLGCIISSRQEWKKY